MLKLLFDITSSFLIKLETYILQRTMVVYYSECSQWHIGMQDTKLPFLNENTGGVFLIHYKSSLRDNMCHVFFHPSFSTLSSLTVHFSVPMGLITVYFTRRENITPQWKEIHLTGFHLGSFVSLVCTVHSKAITCPVFSVSISICTKYLLNAEFFGTMCMQK